MMKKIIALLLMILLLCSSCAAPDPNGGEVSERTWEEARQEIEQLLATHGDDGLNLPQPPVYQPVILEKDKTIKDEQREYFFAFAQKYRLDFLPDLSQEGLPDFSQMKWYIAYVAMDEWVEYGNGHALTADTVNRITKDYFGLTYDLGGETLFPLEIGEMTTTVFCELLSYKEERTPEGELLVTVRFAEYNYDKFAHIDPIKDAYEEYVATRHRIISGKEDQQYASALTEVQFITQDGQSLDRIVSQKKVIRMPEGFPAL